VVVEQIGDKGQIEFVNAVDDVLGRDEASAAELGGLLQHDLGTRHEVRLHERLHRHAALLRRDRLEQVGVDLRVVDVALEVVAAAVGARALQVVVHPAQQDLLRAQLHQVFDLLAVGKQTRQTRAVLQRDLVEQSYLQGNKNIEYFFLAKFGLQLIFLFNNLRVEAKILQYLIFARKQHTNHMFLV
jgi:hypothetical protein